MDQQAGNSQDGPTQEDEAAIITPPLQAEWGPELLARYSDLLLRLYRLGRTAPEEEFQEAAFQEIKQLIPFDGGWWALGVSEAPRDKEWVGPKIFDVYFHTISPKMLIIYKRLAHYDTISRKAARYPGVTINTTPREWFPTFFWPYLDFFGLQQVMTTNLVYPQTGLTTGITFYKADHNHPFTEQERQIKQALMPHLLEAHSRNQIEPWVRSTLPAQHYPLAGIAEREGGLRHAADGFGDMLRREWPDWTGPVLPEPLRTILAAGQGGKFSGAHLAVSVDQREHLALVQIRSLHALDQLSERQLRIARLTADGLSHKEIARQMELSPKTVRNYQTHIYQKLEVSNKLLLAEKLREGSEGR